MVTPRGACTHPGAKTRPTRTLAAGDTVGSLAVVAAPGHTPGQVAFFDRRDGTLLCADAYTTLGGVATTAKLSFPFPLASTATWHRPTWWRRWPAVSPQRDDMAGSTAMDYRQLGRCGLRVSTLTLGTMTIGGAGRFASVGAVDLDGARRQIDLCVDAGVNLIDTADVYSGGLSEEIIGRALEGRRDRVLLATKARMAMGEGPNDAGLSRHHLIAACDASLRRLRTDHIDLYQVHEWDGQTPLEETLDTLDGFVRAGKVRYVGCSNYAAWQLVKALGISDRLHLQRFVSQQIYYSLQAREPEYELVPAAVDQGLGILVWSPLAGGLLSGKYRRDAQPEAGRQLSDWDEPPVRDQEQLHDIVDALVEIAEAHDVSAAQVALAYTLAKPGVTSVIIGARTEEQLVDNLAAADLELSADERTRLDAISAPPLLYPYWHQAKTASDRLSGADLTLLGPHLR